MGDLDVHEMIILKWILREDWTGFRLRIDLSGGLL
jgi:hypothetical protein